MGAYEVKTYKDYVAYYKSVYNLFVDTWVSSYNPPQPTAIQCLSSTCRRLYRLQPSTRPRAHNPYIHGFHVANNTTHFVRQCLTMPNNASKVMGSQPNGTTHRQHRPSRQPTTARASLTIQKVHGIREAMKFGRRGCNKRERNSKRSGR